MATTVTQPLARSLECPICLNVFLELKKLTCSHAVCRACVARLVTAQNMIDNVSCPICKEPTAMPNGDIDGLQRSELTDSLTKDIHGQCNLCDNCKMDEKPPAVAYCQECDEYMCRDCHNIHEMWDKFTGHDVVQVEDILSGKVLKKKRVKCEKHPSEDEECFCLNCKKYICFRCAMMQHTREGHIILEGQEYEDQQRKKVKDLYDVATGITSKVNDYINSIEEKEKKLQIILEIRTAEIHQACEESMKQLRDRRDVLIEHCKRHVSALSKELEVMKSSTSLQLGRLTSARELVGDGQKVALVGEALAARETLCDDLEAIIIKSEPNRNRLENVMTKGECVTLKRVRCENKAENALDIGKIEVSHWVLSKPEDFFVHCDNIDCMTSMPDGRMAFGIFFGLHIVTLDGSHDVFLDNYSLSRLIFMSDGSLIVKTQSNSLMMFSKSLERMNVHWDYLHEDLGGRGGLDVVRSGLDDDEEEMFISSYPEVRKIHFYRAGGGEAVREILSECEPSEVFCMRGGHILVLSGSSTVSVIDRLGKVQHQVIKEGLHAQPALCLDVTILIAWVKHDDGILTIDQYSRDLKPLRTMVADFKILVPERPYYYLRELTSGELAFCTRDRLYVFHKTGLESESVE